MAFLEVQQWLNAEGTNFRSIQLGCVVVLGVVSVAALSRAINMYRAGMAVEEALVKHGAY
ncbi:hypothetical protein CGLO_13188 [Colletotrichum gloeosporioides Cg-14]|uniref:Uncharacterized protein n=1 Tax=Colletotrichum gloeosporioides (strain Cg-14) TaxID=1237896 RepID=T0LHI0_COLGC|nr:hypothetical protein CGLO_13188 [Colletotrichum gloeosporioides Cg-14]